MTTTSEAILAIDLGTSSAKTLIVDPGGQILGRGQASYPTLHPREGFDEQLVDDWMQAIVSATASARRFAPAASIQAIAITGQMHGTVLLDRDGRPLHPAIIWSDRRAASMIDEVQDRLGTDLPMRIGGLIGTGFQALTLAWVMEHRPHIRDVIAHALLPIDLVGYLLTGTFASDASNAVSSGLLDAKRGEWDESLLDALTIPRTWLPDLVQTGTHIGDISLEASTALELRAGIPVFLGGGDAPAAAVGANVVTHSEAMITMSTGAQVMRPTTVYTPDLRGRWHTWPSALPLEAEGASWLHVGAILNAGRAIDWIHRTLAPGAVLGELLALAHTSPVGSGNLLFLPYIAGERSPLLDPFARGAFVGLSDTHQPQHLVRAVLEGIALSLADTLDRMTPEGERPTRITLGGGGSAPEVRQIMANVLGVPLSISPVQESSAFGAARIVAHALGWTSIRDGQGWGPGHQVLVNPIQADHALYEERLAIFRDAAECALPIMHRLQRLDP